MILREQPEQCTVTLPTSSSQTVTFSKAVDYIEFTCDKNVVLVVTQGTSAGTPGSAATPGNGWIMRTDSTLIYRIGSVQPSQKWTFNNTDTTYSVSLHITGGLRQRPYE